MSAVEVVYKIKCLFFLTYVIGKPVRKGSGLNELLNIENSAKVVNIKDPGSGTWTIKVIFIIVMSQ